MTSDDEDACPADLLMPLLDQGGGDAVAVDDLIDRYPKDARLYFLRGSLAAGRQDYAAADEDLRKAVELAPGYRIARFQLGLLQMSSSDLSAAERTWGSLIDEQPDEALSLFAAGYAHLAHDEFERARDLLERGVSNNKDHPAINRDVAAILAQIAAPPADEAATQPFSATQMLLRQSLAGKSEDQG